MTIRFEFHPWVFHVLPVIDVSMIECAECDQHGATLTIGFAVWSIVIESIWSDWRF